MEVYKREREEIPLDWLAEGDRLGGMKRGQRREQKRSIKWEGEGSCDEWRSRDRGRRGMNEWRNGEREARWMKWKMIAKLWAVIY